MFRHKINWVTQDTSKNNLEEFIFRKGAQGSLQDEMVHVFNVYAISRLLIPAHNKSLFCPPITKVMCCVLGLDTSLTVFSWSSKVCSPFNHQLADIVCSSWYLYVYELRAFSIFWPHKNWGESKNIQEADTVNFLLSTHSLCNQMMLKEHMLCRLYQPLVCAIKATGLLIQSVTVAMWKKGQVDILPPPWLLSHCY